MEDEGDSIQSLMKDSATPAYLRSTLQLHMIDRKNGPIIQPKALDQHLIDVAMASIPVPFELAHKRSIANFHYWELGMKTS